MEIILIFNSSDMKLLFYISIIYFLKTPIYVVVACVFIWINTLYSFIFEGTEAGLSLVYSYAQL